MFYRFLAYTRFLYRSTNQHGVHSPFVYQYVTKGLYRNSRFKGSKTAKVALKSLEYFEVGNIDLEESKPGLEAQVKLHFPAIKRNRMPYDFIYHPRPELKKVYKLLNTPGLIHNDTLLLVDQPYCNPQTIKEWESIKEIPGVTVTIDMFHCSAVFFRREQVKQHFRIRI